MFVLATPLRHAQTAPLSSQSSSGRTNYRSVCRTYSSTGIMKLPAAFRLRVSLILSLRYFSLAIPSLYRHVSYFRNGGSDIFPEISNIPSRLRQGPITISMLFSSPFCPEFQKRKSPPCRARVGNPLFGIASSSQDCPPPRTPKNKENS